MKDKDQKNIEDCIKLKILLLFSNIKVNIIYRTKCPLI